MNELEKFSIKASAEIDQEKSALWSATLLKGVPVLVAMAGDRAKIEALTDEQFALFTRLAKFVLSVVAQGQFDFGLEEGE